MLFLSNLVRRIAWYLAWCLAGVAAATALHAQTTNLEMMAKVSGSILGAAKACGINADRIRSASERIQRLVRDKAASAAERKSAAQLFASAQAAGSASPQLAASRCTDTHVSFSQIEVKLGHAPDSTTDAVVAGRGIAPLGALNPDISVRIPKR